MEKINEIVNKLLDECEAKNIPILLAYGTDKISVFEFAPDDVTPERIRKARTTLVTTVKQARRVLEIQA